MKKLLLGLLLTFMPCYLMAQKCCKSTNDKVHWVDPYIGTGGHGHVFLGANVPFGYVQLGPTQITRGWDWCSGYHYSDSIIIGFAHQHLSGTGIGELGDVAFLPIQRKEQTQTKFTHAQEEVCPGYYSVHLSEPEVQVELTATQRAGFHRYTYTQKEGKGLLRLDLHQGIGWDKMVKAAFDLETPNTISGYRTSEGWAKMQFDCFYAETNKPLRLVENQDTIAIFEFDLDDQPLLIKVGMSAVSSDGARKNLEKEIPGWDFEHVRFQARKDWGKQLEKINIETDNNTYKRIFYTAMYHSMVAPSVFNDVDGQYRGSDAQVHQGDFNNYTTFSLWDTYRAAHPLMSLIHQDRLSDMAQTLLHIYKEQGKLPVWHLMANETDCMVGNPGIIVLADLVLKGVPMDKELAFEALKQSALKDDRGMDLLKKYGYIPYDLDPTYETVAKDLEYAIADAGVAKVAKLLGKTDDFNYFHNRSQLYRKHFDKSTGFMRGLGSDGKFHEPFDPFNAIHRQDDYTEGNAWQYAWLVPHDVHGLVGCFKDEKAFVEKFDSLFIVEGDLGAEASPDISGLIGQYAHGNEPSHHIIYMYNYVGQPYKAAPLLRQVMTQLYHADYDGLSGNEDVGQMSSWYIMSSIGLYQVEPSGGKYIIGSPLFNKAEINVGNGKTFTVVTKNNSEKNIYVQSAKLNGVKLFRSYLYHDEITAGGTLELVMGPKPSKWGTHKNERP